MKSLIIENKVKIQKVSERTKPYNCSPSTDQCHVAFQNPDQTLFRDLHLQITSVCVMGMTI